MRIAVFFELATSTLFSFSLSAQNSIMHFLNHSRQNINSKKTFFILLLSIYSQAYGQVAQFSINHWTNETHYNPASSGFLFKHHSNINYRTPDISSNNKEYALSVNYGIRLGEHHGLGINYGQMKTEDVFHHYSDIEMNYISENLLQRSNEINLNYNYQFKFRESNEHILAIGLGIKVLSRTQTNYNWFIKPTILVPDNSPHSSSYNSLNFGLRYQWKNLGLGFSNSSLFHTDGSVKLTKKQGLNFMANYNIKINDSFEINPSLLLRTHRSGVSSQVNALFSLKKKYWIGLNYRSSNYLGFMIGWDIVEKYRISYAYEGNSNEGHHEITIGLRFK